MMSVSARSSVPSAGAQEVFSDLEQWLGGPSARLGIAEVEREAELRGRELIRVMLQGHVDARGDGDVGDALILNSPDGVVLLSHKRLHTRRLLTLFGEVMVDRVGYGARGQTSVHPLDAELQLPGRAYSYELCRRLVRGAVCGPFDEAIRWVADTTSVLMPKRSAEQIVIDAAVDVDTFYAQRAAADEPAGDILVGSIDCKGIPMVKPDPAVKAVRLGKGEKRNKKKMATVAAVFSQAPLPRTPEAVIESLFHTARDDTATSPERTPRLRPTDKRVWASLLAGKDAFISDVAAEMRRRDPDRDRTWVIVTDGERALQQRVCKLFDDVTLVPDLLHVLEKLWTAAYVFHPEGSPQAEAFVRERALRILRGQTGQVVKGLRQMVTKRQLQGIKAKTLLDIASYYYRNRSRMHYDIYLRNGWPIASGSVEGACKNLIKDRFERSGMRWTETMAESMLKLRAVYLSGDFDDYWHFHINQDQRRLHPPNHWFVVPK